MTKKVGSLPTKCFVGKMQNNDACSRYGLFSMFLGAMRHENGRQGNSRLSLFCHHHSAISLSRRGEKLRHENEHQVRDLIEADS